MNTNDAEYELQGWIRGYVDGVINNWLLVAPDSNPGMLQMFRDRDRTPHREMMPWAGEFAGKYLTGAVEVYRLTGDKRLGDHLDRFVKELISCQDTDGYLGPWQKNERLTDHWDPWGHYHAMLGLLTWYEETGDKDALNCAKRIGDLVCKQFLGAPSGKRLVEVYDRRAYESGKVKTPETNTALLHSLCVLYRHVPEPRYLQMAKQIVDEFAVAEADGRSLGGDYFNLSLAGKEFHESHRARWEALHAIIGLADLYRITNDARYRKVLEHIWWSIVKTDRHNTGGFSTGEGACGNPYAQGAIETCCTIAWIALGVEVLKLTGDSVVADELELSTLNTVTGLHSPTGRWVTYNTPMDGMRRSSTQDIAFQAREGTPELNCCSANAPRGFGLISSWGVMQCDGGIALNYYGPSTINTTVGQTKLTIEQTTDYPRNGKVSIKLKIEKPAEFKLMLRIPYWSEKTAVKVNGRTIPEVHPGKYLELKREWKTGDTIDIDLDFSLHFWAGEKECAGKSSIFRGPILLTYDRKYNSMDPDAVPPIDAANIDARIIKTSGLPLVMLEATTKDGKPLKLCDFASAGYTGTPYRSWITVEGVKPVQFNRKNPLRSVRVKTGG